MRECICSSCKNLKGVMDENGAIEIYECEYGYPSEECESCELSETGECGFTCSNYTRDEEQDTIKMLHCVVCGRELQQACDNNEEGSVKCIDCYLKEMD